MAVKVGRNALCPCGSGLKYKRCCGRHEPAAQPVLSNRLTTIILSVAAVLAVAVLVTAVIVARSNQPHVDTTGIEAGSEPEPFYYDAANNRHWHPGHDGTAGHWHQGPPPTQAPLIPPTQPTNTVGTTPAPYEYDAANNRFWHPDHGHWHPGRPPAEAQR